MRRSGQDTRSEVVQIVESSTRCVDSEPGPNAGLQPTLVQHQLCVKRVKYRLRWVHAHEPIPEDLRLSRQQHESIRRPVFGLDGVHETGKVLHLARGEKPAFHVECDKHSKILSHGPVEDLYVAPTVCARASSAAQDDLLFQRVTERCGVVGETAQQLQRLGFGDKSYALLATHTLRKASLPAASRTRDRDAQQRWHAQNLPTVDIRIKPKECAIDRRHRPDPGRPGMRDTASGSPRRDLAPRRSFRNVGRSVHNLRDPHVTHPRPPFRPTLEERDATFGNRRAKRPGNADQR